MRPDHDHLVLASRSPRRRLLLSEAGFEASVIDPGLDDGAIRPNQAVTPAQWVAALAYLKARAGAEQLPPGARVIGADTVVVKDDRIIGQPRDERHAREMIRSIRDGEHQVITGVAFLRGGRRLIFADTARVNVGPIPEQDIEEYLATAEWRGKAGAYNLAERLQAGWPIRVAGDPTTVMGLPMKMLRPYLAPNPAQAQPA